MMKIIFAALIVTSNIFFMASAYAGNGFFIRTNLTQQQFLEKTYGAVIPDSDVLWLNKSNQQVVEKILGHKINFLRVRYWKEKRKSAWIVEEPGKEELITIGVVIDSNKIKSVDIMQCSESDGVEIQESSFTNQFVGASLNKDKNLDKTIKGRTGATPSVSAVKNVAALALYLSNQAAINNAKKKNEGL